MTICVAALAEESKAIVCVADKGLAYGDSLQWDSDSAKMIYLEPSNSILMFSGDEEGVSRVLATFLETEHQCGFGRAKTRKWCEIKYKEALDEILEIKFLNPRLLEKRTYLSAITDTQINPYIRDLAQKIEEFNMGCELLVCGFDIADLPDTPGKPFIFDVDNPGQVIDMTHTGFHAIGSGSHQAISKLLSSEYRRSFSLDRALYEVFNAKASAEITPSVGMEWDAAVTIGVNRFQVPKEIKELIEKAWVQSTRSPFEKYDQNLDLEPPPNNWKQTLRKYAKGLMSYRIN